MVIVANGTAAKLCESAKIVKRRRNLKKGVDKWSGIWYSIKAVGARAAQELPERWRT